MNKIEISKEKVLEVVKERSPATLKEISFSLKLNPMFISGYLSALKDMNVIKSKPIGTSIVYTVNGEK